MENNISTKFKNELNNLRNNIIQKLNNINNLNNKDFSKLYDEIQKIINLNFADKIKELKDIFFNFTDKNFSKDEIINIFENELIKLNEFIRILVHISYSQNNKYFINNLVSYIYCTFNYESNEINKIIYNKFNSKVNINPQLNENQGIQNKINLKFNEFTSKEIQEKNLKITREFEKMAINFIKDEDSIENQSLAEFLIKIANISRKSYNNSHDFLKILYKEFEKTKNNDISIYSLDFFKKAFSDWVKNNNSIDYFLNDFLKNKNLSHKNYFDVLYKNLLILYYQSQLAFPLIEINFDCDESCIFDSKKMIDCFNRPKKYSKVNFVIFPSLFSNGNFLENGKQWVFTYINNDKKKTFFFENLKLESIIEENKKFKIQNLNDKLELKIFIEPKLNYNILKGTKHEFTFSIKDKNTNQMNFIKSSSKIELKENQEFVNCEFNFMDEVKISFIKKEKK